MSYEVRRDSRGRVLGTAPYDPRSYDERQIGAPVFDLELHLHQQRSWSQRTFGPGPRTIGVVTHIRKELVEIERAPTDLTEWVDVMLLAFDGAWRAGHSPDDIVRAIAAKQLKNQSRTWPDWRTLPDTAPIEHVPHAETLGDA